MESALADSSRPTGRHFRGAAALVALELALDAGTGAVPGGQATYPGDEVLAGQEAGPEGDEDGALGELLDLPDAGLRLGRRARGAADGGSRSRGAGAGAAR